MKTIQLQDGFGITRLQIFEQSKPSLKPGKVLLKPEATSLNYVDLLVVKGQLNPDLSLPYVPRADSAGVDVVVETVWGEICSDHSMPFA